MAKRRWRGWCDFGAGVLGDIGCHSFHPVFRALKPKHPKSVVLGTVDVNSEVNTLSLEAVARNPESTGYYAGIDAVMLESAQ